VDFLTGPSATIERVAFNLAARAPHARFINEMFNPIWVAGLKNGVDPVVLIAQAGKETAWGHYTGKVPANFYNTCGLKIRDPSLAGPDQEATMAHAQFASFSAGADAQAQHWRGYAHLPVAYTLLDPRYVHVYGKGTPVASVEGMNSRWAGPTYGTELAALVNLLKVST